MHLDWRKRLQIAIGSARGLAYLHELAHPPIIHRDIKSTNILLDENLNAKVADFGLSKLLSDTQKGHVSTQVKGTLGYLDPEYYMTEQLSEKSDVYSFGVVMLELITARLPFENGTELVTVVKTAFDQYDEEYYGLRDMMDPNIVNQAKNIRLRKLGLKKFVQLALECVDDSASNRPSMHEVVKRIEIIWENDDSTRTMSGEAVEAGVDQVKLGEEGKEASRQQGQGLEIKSLRLKEGARDMGSELNEFGQLKELRMTEGPSRVNVSKVNVVNEENVKETGSQSSRGGEGPQD